MSLNTTYTWEREDGSEVLIDIEFTCSRYYPAVVGRSPDRCYPAEGGDIESIEFHPRDDDCTDELLAEFRALYHQGGKLQDDVDTACYEYAADVTDDGPDDW